MTNIKRNQGVGPPIHSRFQYHLIARIAELRPPQEMSLHWLGEGDHGGHKYIGLLFREAGGDLMLGSGTNSLVFQGHRDAH
jgi:hypothetical protein